MTLPDAVSWPGQEHRRLTEAVGYADVVLGSVSTRLLPSPTPCRAWNVRMLLEHTDDSLAVLLEGLTAQRIVEPPAPVLSDTVPSDIVPPAAARSAADLVGALRRRAAELLDASAQADGGSPVSVEGHPLPVDCLRTVGVLEIAVHAWDISQACGQRLPVPEDLAAGLLTQVGLLVPRLGREPLFAAPVQPPARSTSGERLIAYLGRPVRLPRRGYGGGGATRLTSITSRPRLLIRSMRPVSAPWSGNWVRSVVIPWPTVTSQSSNSARSAEVAWPRNVISYICSRTVMPPPVCSCFVTPVTQGAPGLVRRHRPAVVI